LINLQQLWWNATSWLYQILSHYIISLLYTLCWLDGRLYNSEFLNLFLFANPFGGQKWLQNPKTKEKNVRGTPWVRKTSNRSLTEQYLIASSALCIIATVLYLLSVIKPINKCYLIWNICGILSNGKARRTLGGCPRNPRVLRNHGWETLD
jgi:hypothetical protein